MLFMKIGKNLDKIIKKNRRVIQEVKCPYFKKNIFVNVKTNARKEKT